VHQGPVKAQNDVELVVDTNFVTVDVLHDPAVAGQLHEPLITGDQLALVAERHEVRLTHQSHFEPELAGLDHRRKDTAGIGLSQFRVHAESGQRDAHHAIRTQMLGQCAGNFALELLQHGRELHHVGLATLAGLLDVA
jgi:hypothetical protein